MGDIFVWIGETAIVDASTLGFTYSVVTSDGDFDTAIKNIALALSPTEKNAALLEDARAHCAAKFGTTAGQDELLGSFAGPGWTRIDKLADTSRTNNTLADDPDLLFTALAGEVFQVRLMVFFVTASTPDFKYRVAHTGTGELLYRSILRGAGGAAPAHVAMFVGADVTDVVLTGTGVNGSISEEMILIAGTGGDIKFQWAQNTTNATPATVVAGSFLEYHRVL